jgi:hypothetical protein
MEFDLNFTFIHTVSFPLTTAKYQSISLRAAGFPAYLGYSALSLPLVRCRP